MSLTIWSNAKFSEAVTRLLTDGTRAHKLIFSQQASTNVLTAGPPTRRWGRQTSRSASPTPRSACAGRSCAGWR